MPPRIDLDRSDILRVVRAFYARVRQDETLGPIFGSHVDDWPTHEEKITRFWASALLFEGAYHGNPMREHMKAGNVRPDHFPRWLELFDETLTEMIAEPKKAQWSMLAHRIGRELSMGLSDFQRPKEIVPHLT